MEQKTILVIEIKGGLVSSCDVYAVAQHPRPARQSYGDVPLERSVRDLRRGYKFSAPVVRLQGDGGPRVRASHRLDLRSDRTRDRGDEGRKRRYVHRKNAQRISRPRVEDKPFCKDRRKVTGAKTLFLQSNQCKNARFFRVKKDRIRPEDQLVRLMSGRFSHAFQASAYLLLLCRNGAIIY